MDLKDKTILITGGAVRIGAALCRAFASSGSRIIIHCNNSLNEAEKLAKELPGNEHRVIREDLSKPNAAEKIFAQTDGKIDILINNASIFKLGLLGEETLSDAEYQMRVNFKTPLELMKLFNKQTPRGGCIINILDQRIVKTDPDGGSYSISKKSLADATLSAALQWAPEIRVNALAPGPVIPPVGLEDSKMEMTLKTVPLKKPVSMNNLCSAGLFLASNESITGQILFVDCGQHLS